MQRLEIKSRVDAKLGEWKRHLDAMRVKVDESEDDATAEYNDRVAALEKEHAELIARASRALDPANEKADTDAEVMEKALDEWAKRAAKTRDDLLK